MERAGFAFLMFGIESTQDKTLRSMRKGFNIKQIREYCKGLRKTSMIRHGYFILGNIGETVPEMLEIPSFAPELGLDTIALSTLRAHPYSGLDELVANNPGYHIAPNAEPPQLLRYKTPINSKHRQNRPYPSDQINYVAIFLGKQLPHNPQL